MTMSAYHLRRSEVAYELKIRNQPTEGSAGECRKRLSRSLTSNTPIDEAVVNLLDPVEEIRECEGKYNVLSSLVSDYEGNHHDKEHHRISARLVHLCNRVERIPVGASTEGDLDHDKENLLTRCKDLLDSFKESQATSDEDSQEEEAEEEVPRPTSLPPSLLKNTVSDSTNTFELPRTHFDSESERRQEEFRRLKEGWQRKEEMKLEDDQRREEKLLLQERKKLIDERRKQEEKWHEEELRVKENRRHHDEMLKKEDRRIFDDLRKQEEREPHEGGEREKYRYQDSYSHRDDRVDRSRPKSVPVYKWGLKFDNSGPSIAAFLERVEELRRARGISHQELYESAVDLFSGSALVWYRAAANRIKSWPQLTKELREVFQPANYDLRLHQEIFNRFQGENEPVDLYISAMEGLYSRLADSIPESTRLAQIYNNLHPQLQDRLALSNIETLEQLRSMGRRAEAGRMSMIRQRPSSGQETTLEPDLAYQDSTRHRKPLQGRVSALQTTPLRERQDMSCWNCGEKNHRFRFCRKPRKRFCYGCGKDNTTKRDCNNCYPKNGQSREPETQ